MKFTNDLGSDNIKGLVWTLAVPSMLSQLVSVLYSIVDRMYIGNIPSNGTQALAGVGVCGPIVTLISSFAFLVGIGGAPLVSINLGEKNTDAAKKVIANCFVYILALAVPVTVLAYIFRRPILLTFGATEAVYPYAETYFSLYLIGTVFALTATGMNQFIITQGHSRSGMFSVLIGAIINIVLDPIFIFALHMGVAGAAVATALSQLLSAVMVCWFLARPKTEESVRLELSKLRTDWKLMRRTVHIGLPAGLQAVLYSISNMIIITAVNRFGTDTAAAWVAMGKVDAFTWLVLSAMGLAVMTFVGQNFGANSMQRVRESIRDCMIMTSGFAVLISLLFVTLGKYLLVIFTTDQNVIALAMRIIYYIMPWYLLYVPVEVYSGSLRGIGDTLVPFIITAVGICIARVVWIFTIVPLHNDISTVAVAYPITWGLTSLAYMIYFRYVKKHKIGKIEQAA